MKNCSKKVLKGVGAAAAAALGTGIVRAAFFYKPEKVQNTTTFSPEKVDVDRYIQHLSEAIRIPTISNRDDSLVDWDKFDEFHAFLKKSFPLIHEKLTLTNISKASLMYRWQGKDSTLDPICLLAHQDVVPISEGTEKDWNYPAFSGEIADGFIWGRGALDIKNHLIGVLEAVETLLEEGYEPQRDVYLCFGHNEELMEQGETCGAYCMMEEFKKQGIHLDSVLDEGGAILPVNVKGVLQKNVAGIGLAEKGQVNFEISVNAVGGHSAQPPKHTALGQLAKLIEALEDHPYKGEITPTMYGIFDTIGRNTTFPMRVIASNLPVLKPLLRTVCMQIPPVASMLHTTTAVTMASASAAPNVLPQVASAVANFRIMPGLSMDDVEAHIRKYVGNKGEVKNLGGNNPTAVSPTDSRAFKAIQTICEGMNPDNLVIPYLVMGGTDSRNYEPVCSNIYRYSPFLVNTELLLTTHGTNERLPIDSIEDGIAFFKRYIKMLA